MSAEDLQIGDTWTEPDHRGKGIASWAINEIVRLKQQPGRRFWYVVENNNLPSIRAIEKAGFVRVGSGMRTKRLGLKLLGSFEMTNETNI